MNDSENVKSFTNITDMNATNNVQILLLNYIDVDYSINLQYQSAFNVCFLLTADKYWLSLFFNIQYSSIGI